MFRRWQSMQLGWAQGRSDRTDEERQKTPVFTEASSASRAGGVYWQAWAHAKRWWMAQSMCCVLRAQIPARPITKPPERRSADWTSTMIVWQLGMHDIGKNPHCHILFFCYIQYIARWGKKNNQMTWFREKFNVWDYFASRVAKRWKLSEQFPEDAKKFLKVKKKICNISDIYWKCSIFWNPICRWVNLDCIN